MSSNTRPTDIVLEPKSTPKDSDDLLEEQPSPDTLPSIPITANKLSKTMPIILIASNCAATILLVVFIFYPIYFATGTNLVTEKFATIILCVTLPATFIGLYSANQMRRLYIQRYVFLYESGLLKPLDRTHCTATVGVSGFKEDAQSWKIGLSYLSAGLITAFLNSSLTPKLASIPFTHSAVIHPDHDKYSCFTSSANRSELSPWSWQLPDSSYLGINWTAIGECETVKIGNVIAAISSKYYLYAYPIGGLLVDRASVGAPIDPSGNPSGEFGTINKHTDFQWATQCFPSLTNNPVRCRAAPEAEFNITTKSIGINVGGCNSTNNLIKIDPTIHGASIFAMCPNEEKFGALSLVFGAVNYATVPWAAGMQDRTFNLTTTSHDSLNRSKISYAVKCTVDIAPSVSYRQMTLTRRTGYLTGMVDNFLFHIIGNSSATCTPRYASGAEIPISTFLTPRALIVGAASLRLLLIENYFMDGTMTMLHRFVSLFNPDGAPPEIDSKQVYTFAESQNALEDTLGTISGMALGMYWGAQMWNVTTGAVEIANGKGEFSGWRMGSGQAWNVIYAIPTAASTIILSYLLRRGIRDSRL